MVDVNAARSCAFGIRKPDLIKQVDGCVTELSEWETYKKAKQAMVKLSNGEKASVFIPSPVTVHRGISLHISLKMHCLSGVYEHPG